MKTATKKTPTTLALESAEHNLDLALKALFAVRETAQERWAQGGTSHPDTDREVLQVRKLVKRFQEEADALRDLAALKAKSSAEDTPKAKPTVWDRCGRCGGRGEIPCFRHVQGGICFECDGRGEVPRGRSRGRATKAAKIHTLQVGNVLWQFSASVRVSSRDYTANRAPRARERADDLLIQAVTGQGRSGRTLFRIRLVGHKDVAVGRRIFEAVRDGHIRPEEVTNEFLGFTPGRSQVSRNRRGVEFL